MNDSNSSIHKMSSQAERSESALRASSLTPGFAVRCLLGLAILVPAFYVAWTFPFAPKEITAALLLYLIVLLIYPAAWIVIIPVAVPLVELGFWSGRLYFGEFDLLLLVTLGGVLWRRELSLKDMGAMLSLIAVILLLYNIFVTWMGLLPLSAGELGMWNDQLSSLNGLREAKGFFAALLLLPVLVTEAKRGTNVAHLFSIGMICGVLAAGATVVWERLLFTGLWNFTDPYRISGMFFSTLTGGAAVDAYLMLATPFIGALLLYRPGYAKGVAACLLALLAAYCLYVTYSRANYPAVLVALAVFAAGAWMVSPWRQIARPRFVIAGAIVLIAGSAAAYHLFIGTTITKRFAQTMEDSQKRLDHWSDALRLVTAEKHGRWIGAGRGTFPLKYHADSVAANRPLVVPRLTRTAGESFITLSPGIDSGITYLRQRLALSAANEYRLRLRVRGTSERHEYLIIEFCERHVLKFLPECVWEQIAVPQNATQWRDYDIGLNLGRLGKQKFGLTGRRIGGITRPVDISILYRGVRNKIDIASIEMVGADGKQILRNSGFHEGLDHWFLSYGNHLRWHIKNVFVYAYFEGGALGLAVLAVTLVLVYYRLLRRIADNDGFAVLYASAISGVLLVGLFDSLFDEPRIALLFTLLIWLSLLPPGDPNRHRRPDPGDSAWH